MVPVPIFEVMLSVHLSLTSCPFSDVVTAASSYVFSFILILYVLSFLLSVSAVLSFSLSLCLLYKLVSDVKTDTTGVMK